MKTNQYPHALKIFINIDFVFVNHIYQILHTRKFLVIKYSFSYKYIAGKVIRKKTPDQAESTSWDYKYLIKVYYNM